MLFDFPGQEPAPLIDRLARLFHSNRWEGKMVDSKSGIALLDKIFATVRRFKRADNHGDPLLSLFLEAPRGSIEDFGDYKRLRREGVYRNRREFEEDWKACYPDVGRWYWFQAVETDFGYRAIFLNRDAVISSDPRRKEYGNQEDLWTGSYVDRFLTWVDKALNRAVEMLEEGTYNDYVAKNLDPHSRIGTITRRDYWKALPERKKAYLERFGPDEPEEFVSLVSRGIGVDKPKERIKEMTLGLYLDVCALGYRAYYEDEADLSPRELYKKHGDHRDGGMLKLPDWDPIAYENWDPDSRENFNGNHLFQVEVGSSRTMIILSPVKDKDGYYFWLRGSGLGISDITIKFFLAIQRAGYPIELYRAEDMADRFTETDRIGIVPEGVFPFSCESWFPDEKTIDYINLNEDNLAILPYVEWQELDKVELLESEA